MSRIPPVDRNTTNDGVRRNFDAIQKMLDIYAQTKMLPKMDVAQFKHAKIVAPLE